MTSATLCSIQLRFLLSFLTLLVATTSPLRASDKGVETAPVPAWVDVRSADMDAFGEENTQNGFTIMLSDQQGLVGVDEPAFYMHQVGKAHTQAAANTLSQISIPFVPAYQSYTIHSLTVLRGDKTIDKSRDATVTLTKQETMAGEFENEATATADIYLSDIRAGDVIDIAYTITGQNDAYGKHAIGTLPVYAAPGTRGMRYRLLTPKGHALAFKRHGGLEEPTVTTGPNHDIYEWSRDTADIVDLEMGVPDWYSSVPFASYTDFEDWDGVRDWGMPFFALDDAATESVAETARDIAGDAEPLEALRKLSAFMKSSIRYVGLEIGRNGYRPFPPRTVLDRRFGDCKDQTMLLVAMLRAVGIDAVPILVHSSGEEVLDALGPTPLAFDHVIVRATIDGQTYWTDPTLNLPNGFEEELTPPPYEKGLILSSNATGLEAIPKAASESDQPTIEISDSFDMSGGFDEEGTWTRTSVYRGLMAIDMAALLESVRIDQYQEEVLQAYETSFSGIEPSAPLDVAVKDGVLTIREAYILPEPASRRPGSKLKQFSYTPQAIHQMFTWVKPKGTRKAPLAIIHPLDTAVTLTLKLKDDDLEDYSKQIDTAFFKYSQSGAHQDDGSYVINYRYKTLTDIVPAEDVAAHAEKAQDALGGMSLTIQAKDGGSHITSLQRGSTAPDIAQRGYQLVLSKIDKMLNNPDEDPDVKAFVAEIIEEDEIPLSMKRYFISALAQSYGRTGPHDQRLFIYDSLLSLEGRPNYRAVLDRADILEYLGRFEDANRDLRTAIELSSDSALRGWPDDLWDRVRLNLWRLKDYEELATVLEMLVEHESNLPLHLRELAVVHTLNGDKEKAKAVRQQMKKRGMKLPEPLPKKPDSSFQREPQHIFRAGPIYPELARQMGIEGYAVVSVTIKENGTVEDCEVVDANPRGYFDDIACRTASAFVFYPPLKGEKGGDIVGYLYRFSFDLED